MAALSLLFTVIYPMTITGSRNEEETTQNPNLCPFHFDGTPRSSNDETIPSYQIYNEALLTLNIKDVFKDIEILLTDSQDCWPADIDYNNNIQNYGGLFIRMAWHCSGTFRNTDNSGGCAGGRQRYEPEASWEDNTNLDKARALLGPIKEKYGDALSWGDLFVFAGTASLYYMGAPVTQICAGRIDDINGTKSIKLNTGCSEEDNGNCEEPLGTDTLELIYVNPEGVNGIPNPVPSAERIRNVFSRMGMNDSETVALIGGGHTFGRCHGACPLGAGNPPRIDPDNPWPGNCGTGNGPDTFTSGFDGDWTQNIFEWDNAFFIQLVRDEYELELSSGGKYQWKNQRNGLLMLTTDLALREDDIYYEIVKNYAADIDAFGISFSNAWEKLVTNSENEWAENKHCIDAEELMDIDEIDDDQKSLFQKWLEWLWTFKYIKSNGY